MPNVPQDRAYTKEHEWVESTGKDRVRVGITDYAQKQLGDIVFVELPAVGNKFEAGEAIGSVESVKSVSDIFLPVSGAVAAVNEELNDSPEDVNSDPYDGGWMFEITLSNAAELKDLLTAAQYEDYIKAESE
ncbi:glycine cleavage system protein GcvH [Kitasatospora sp. NPDC052868]|uniref:glycine cleavage system protein GcvH n=1 Tax=Kitasatospora sp. NPDC052868 TaxID=3364060 RepID=UPI0037CCB982